MRKIPSLLLGIAALALSSTANATGDCAGFGNCDDNQINAQAQGQQQGQQQGQKAYGGDGGDAYSKAYGGKAYGGNAYQQQGQIGINKNYNTNKVLGIQGQLQGNKQQAVNKVSIKSDASGNAVAAFAPSISSRSTTNCISTYAASGGGGGTGSIFSLGLSIPIRDEDCVMEQAIRTGFESNNARAQGLALELYEHQVTAIMVREGHDSIEKVALGPTDAETIDVMYSEERDAWVPKEQHPTFRRAAAIAYTEMLMQAGYEPNIQVKNYGGMMNVSHIVVNGESQLLDEDLVESVLEGIDDDNVFKPVDASDRN